MKASTRHIAMEVSNASDTDDDEYIEIKLYSPCQSRDFEFPMGSVPWNREAIEFPADELFYKGKLLPLHLPSRLQMVQKLRSPDAKRYHCRSGVEAGEEEEDDSDRYYSLPSFLIMPTTAPSTDTSITLVASCNVSPSDSHRVSFHFTPEEDECFFEWSNDLRYQDEKQHSFNARKCSSTPSCGVWSKSLKQIKLSLICRKFKASKNYLRSLFTKAASAGGGRGNICSGAAEFSSPSTAGSGSGPEEFRKSQKQTSSEQTEDRGQGLPSFIKKRTDREPVVGRQDIKSDSDDKSTSSSSSSSNSSSPSSSSSLSSCSSSSSFKLNGEFQPMMRSSKASSELERSIEGAIAHCKKSLP